MPPLRMGYAVLFPGQGSQFVGMGADLFEARPDLLGGRADDILGFSLRTVCLEGPEEELTRTEHAQPALFALSFALYDELQRHLPRPAAGAGHSVGEYTALASAGYLRYEDALAVVAERGRAMAAAADREPSGMVALIGTDLETAEDVCAMGRAGGGRLWVANLNAPGQVVVAGGLDDLSWLEENAHQLGLRRVIRLKVAGAFHSPFMESAAGRVAAAFRAISVREGDYPVWSNVTAQALTATEVAALGARQVVSPVRFSDSLSAMAAAGASLFVHVGPGDVTVGMARRSAPQSIAVAVSTLADIGAGAEAVGSTIR